MMLNDVLKGIVAHPLNSGRKGRALFRFFKWQIASRILRRPYVHPFTEHSRLLISRGMTGATGNLYCGLHDFEDMSFLIHFLRAGDLFVDVGANVGSYTVLASAEVGARTIAIEPIPSTFGGLAANVSLNDIGDLVETYNIGVGREPGRAGFTTSLDAANHVAAGDDSGVITVRLETLDGIVGGNAPRLMKLDVEGFETEVLKGAADTLANPSLKALIVELNGSGKRYGHDDEDVHRRLLADGFSPFRYVPFERRLVAVKSYGPKNTIYARDLPFVSERLLTARKIKVNALEI